LIVPGFSFAAGMICGLHAEAGHDRRVAALGYVAAGAPDSGQSFKDWWKDYPPEAGAAEIKPYGKDGFVALTPKGVETCFVHDLSAEEGGYAHTDVKPRSDAFTARTRCRAHLKGGRHDSWLSAAHRSQTKAEAI